MPTKTSAAAANDSEPLVSMTQTITRAIPFTTHCITPR
jgi:hypothetical protein